MPAAYYHCTIAASPAHAKMHTAAAATMVAAADTNVGIEVRMHQAWHTNSSLQLASNMQGKMKLLNRARADLIKQVCCACHKCFTKATKANTHLLQMGSQLFSLEIQLSCGLQQCAGRLISICIPEPWSFTDLRCACASHVQPQVSLVGARHPIVVRINALMCMKVLTRLTLLTLINMQANDAHIN